MKIAPGPILLLLLLCSDYACTHDRAMISPTIPQFTVRAVEIRSDANHFVVARADGLTDYIGKYGDTGWIRGLCDERLLSRTDAKSSSQELIQMRVDQLRVKDLFLTYFDMYFSGAAGPFIKFDWTREDQDKKISLALAQLEKKDSR